MSSKQQVQTNSSEEGLKLPEPDPENITVLTDNLPNKPILPWHHYDSPWSEAQAEHPEQSETAQEVEEQEEEVLDIAGDAATEELEPLVMEQGADELEEESLVAAVEETPIDELEPLEMEQEADELEEESLVAAVEETPIDDFETLETPKEKEEPLVELVKEESDTLTDELKQLG